MRKIPGYSRYLADDDGNIWTISWKRSGKRQLIKPAISKHGYYHSTFVRDDGKYITMKFHRLIALAYLGEQNRQDINHINGIKLDNRPINLEYCSHAYNCKHSFDTGLQKAKRGELNGRSKLTDEDIINIRKIAASGGRYYGRKALALKYGISEGHVKDIVTGRRGVWSHI